MLRSSVTATRSVGFDEANLGGGVILVRLNICWFAADSQCRDDKLWGNAQSAMSARPSASHDGSFALPRCVSTCVH
jgi:hypothetical protein